MKIRHMPTIAGHWFFPQGDDSCAIYWNTGPMFLVMAPFEGARVLNPFIPITNPRYEYAGSLADARRLAEEFFNPHEQER